jgi:hypothetical protein
VTTNRANIRINPFDHAPCVLVATASIATIHNVKDMYVATNVANHQIALVDHVSIILDP